MRASIGLGVEGHVTRWWRDTGRYLLGLLHTVAGLVFLFVGLWLLVSALWLGDVPALWLRAGKATICLFLGVGLTRTGKWIIE